MPPRSRATRHQDAASRPRQGQAMDLDPTDGLPVQRYAWQKVRINQDASAETSSANPKSVESPEWAAQFNTPTHPWPEPPLPSYYDQLSPWNKEMIRRARAGNTNRILSTWDRKNNCWISGADQERKLAAAAKATTNQNESIEKPRNEADAGSSKSDDESGAEDSSNEFNKSADEEEDGDETAPFKTSTTKRRKVTSGQHGNEDTSRYFEVRRWVPIPPTQPGYHDRSYLAPRRPGMPPLYAPEYAQQMFGRYHSSASLTNTAGYDLGEGGGLNNASGVLAAGSSNDAGVVTPRKNIPPRRKKKKLGGPGRKKANANPTQITDAIGAQNSAATGVAGQGAGTDDMQGIEGSGLDANGNPIQDPADDNNAQDDGDNESGSEAEGSEEGEIDESGGVAPADQSFTAPDSAITDSAVTTTDNNVIMPQSIDDDKEVAKEDEMDTSEPTVQTIPPNPAITNQDNGTVVSPQPALAAPSTDIDVDMIDPALESPITATTTPPADRTPHVAADQSIFTLPQPTDPEEREIVEENAAAITGTGSSTAPVEKDSETTEMQNLNLTGASATATPDIVDTTIPTIAVEPAPTEDIKDQEVTAEAIAATTSGTADVNVPATDTDQPAKETEKADTEGAEVNFLGALDAAIDREVSEGVQDDQEGS